MKLGKGNVFSCVFLSVCLSTDGEGLHVTINHNMWNLTIDTPSAESQAYPLHGDLY